MAKDLFQYDQMVERALRGVVRDALRKASRDGLRGNHHFYIGFATQMPDVTIPEVLRTRYPEEMTIVLQHQFWDLEVTEEQFAVTLSFHKQLERLTIPLAAIRSFADPSVNFSLEFASPEVNDDKPLVKAGPPVAIGAKTGDAQPGDATPGEGEAKPDEAAERATAEVVTLDSFRKR